MRKIMHKYKFHFIGLLVIGILVLSLGLIYFLMESSSEDRIWISPGKIEISNFYPGAEASWDLLVHNDTSYATQFQISYRIPNHVENGYSPPVDSVKDWVTIENTIIALNPYETQAVAVTLDMPLDAEAPGDEWEFWVSVIENSQEGLIQTELCSRWLVSMR